jgi:3-oxoacyl-[acyl-carrier protein] reductase
MTTTYKKIALVTGASRGIRRATAVALVNAGAYVIIHYGRSGSDANSVRKQTFARIAILGFSGSRFGKQMD